MSLAMAERQAVTTLARRPEFEVEPLDASGIGEVARPLSRLELVVNNDAVRKVAILVALAVVWEIYARWLNNPLLFPSFSETITTFVTDLSSGALLDRISTSLRSLVLGYGAGLALAAVLTTVAVSTRFGTDLLNTLTAMFNPLPAIALLPLSLIWFGLGIGSLVFVIVHSVLWRFRSTP